MRTYIWQRYNTVAKYIAKRHIMYLREAAERKRGARLGIWWRKKAGIYLTGAGETAEATTEAHGMGWINKGGGGGKMEDH